MLIPSPLSSFALPASERVRAVKSSKGGRGGGGVPAAAAARLLTPPPLPPPSIFSGLCGVTQGQGTNVEKRRKKGTFPGVVPKEEKGKNVVHPKYWSGFLARRHKGKKRVTHCAKKKEEKGGGGEWEGRAFSIAALPWGRALSRRGRKSECNKWSSQE